MKTPATLRELARRNRLEARRLIEEAELWERHAADAEAEDLLTVPDPEGTTGDMQKAARVQISRGSSNDAFVIACNKKGLTIRMLAEELGVSHATLSYARKGQRSISRKLAEKIEKRIGFAANDENWPMIRTT